MNRHYPALIHQDPGTGFGISFPDFPGCISIGNTVEEALASGAEALQGHVDMMRADGDLLPDPAPISEIDTDERAAAEVVSLVAVHIPGKAKRVQITLEENLLDEIAAVSSNRSGFLAEAARTRLGLTSPNPVKEIKVKNAFKTGGRKTARNTSVSSGKIRLSQAKRST